MQNSNAMLAGWSSTDLRDANAAQVFEDQGLRCSPRGIKESVKDWEGEGEGLLLRLTSALGGITKRSEASRILRAMLDEVGMDFHILRASFIAQGSMHKITNTCLVFHELIRRSDDIAILLSATIHTTLPAAV